MTTFTIDTDNNITAFPTPELAAGAVGAGAQLFGSQQELAELATSWPAERLVEIWNSLPGVKPLKEFQKRQGRHQPDLGAHPAPGPTGEAEGGTEGQGWRTGGQGRARQSQGEQEGHPGEEGPQTAKEGHG